MLVPCGIPFMFGILRSSDKNIVPDAVLANGDIDLIIDEAVPINLENKAA
jgi:NADH oxidase (H2O2-forming)